MDNEIALIIFFVILPLVILVIVLPITAIVKASRAKSRVMLLETEVSRLQAQLADVLRMPKEASAPDTAETAAAAVVPEIVTGSILLSDDRPTSDYRVRTDTPSVVDAATESSSPPEGVPDEPPVQDDQASVTPTAPEEKAVPKTQVPSIEERIGVVWFTRIGALVGMVVTGWFFKYMVDNDWIGPWGRVALGATVGTAVLGLGEWLFRRGRTHSVFNQGLLGLGLALLLITAYASFGFYHLLPSTIAFAIIALLCFFGGALAHFHKSEIILVFSLLAAFLNPIMLSTGVDRPIALFAYLLVMTVAAHFLAVLHGFVVATFTAAGGVFVLFSGWYGRYFDIHPAPSLGMYDDPLLNRPGDYLSMLKRWIPLLFAALFVLEWAGAAVAHLQKNRRITGTVLLLMAAAASHGAVAALLYDSPLLLGAGLLLFGSFFAWLLIQYGLTEWLFLTMIASFSILACLKNEIEVGDLLPVLTAAGLLSTLYFAIFLRAAIQKDRRPSPILQLLIAGAGLGFFLLGMLFLMPDHFRALAAFVTGLTGVFLLTAVVIASPVMSVGASLVGFAGLLVSHIECEEVDFGLVGIAGVWFLLHTAVITYDALKRRREWTFIHMFVLSFAGVAFAGLFLNATPEKAEILRAALSLGEGIVYLFIGTLVLRAPSQNQKVSLLPLGMAALAFTASLGFLLSGPSLTVAWAAEAAILAYLAARSGGDDKTVNPGWIIASVGVFAAALVHLFSMDVPWIWAQRILYLETAGASGMLMPRAFAHPQAWSLSALGFAFLLSVYFLRKQPSRTFSGISKIGYLILGHGAFLWLFIHEFRLLFTTGPDIPPGIPADEMMSMWNTYMSALYDQGMRLQTVTTVVMGIYALLLITLGFIIREAWHRRLGMALFAATLVKLTLFDIWKFETLFKIIVGGATAFLLLLGGFLYARFGSRLKSIVSENSDKIVSLIVFAALSSMSAKVEAFDTGAYEQKRAITDIVAAGDYAVEVDPALYQASRCALHLCDIRIAAPDGTEVPYALFTAETREARIRDILGILDPQIMPDGSTRAVLDLGEAPPIHSRLVLDISGSDYLRSTVVESSVDGLTFGVIAENEPVYDIPSQASRAVKKSIEYPPSSARYLRITLNKGEDKIQLRILNARFESVGQRPLKEALRSIPIAVSQAPSDKEDGRAVFTLSALPPKVPFNALRFETEDREFVRQIELESSTHKNAWFSMGTFNVYRIRRGTAPVSILENLHLDTGLLSRPFIRMKVDNGDNPPLHIAKVFAEYVAQSIVLRAPAPGPYTLYVGKTDDKPPRYDLASLIAEGSYNGFKPAGTGPLQENPLFKKAVPETKPVPWTEKHALVLQISVAFIALLLLLWTIRLLRKSNRT